MREQVNRSLAHYLWQDSEHRVVYEALRATRAQDRESLQRELPAHATRRGFPDVNWQNYFADPVGAGRSPEQMENLIRELILAAGAGR